MEKTFDIEQLKELREVVSNCIYLNPSQKNTFKDYVIINNALILKTDFSNNITSNGAGIGKLHREFLNISLTFDKLKLKNFTKESLPIEILYIKVNIDPINKTVDKQINHEKMEKFFKHQYLNHYFVNKYKLFVEYEGSQYILTVSQISLLSSPLKNELNTGFISNSTQIEFVINDSCINVTIESNVLTAKNIFKPDFNFSELGVGGLDTQLYDIFRRAFSSRRLPDSLLKAYGISHIKGLILYGPPGTGKTLIARQLGKCLQAKEPVIVKGPELFNKYVGETESNLRKLFEPAISEYKKMGDKSPLHIIIFDEFDAIAKARGSTNSGTGVSDNLVNQLLSLIDGVDQINNILVIGMTNRLDIIDKAILRPGRFEVHVEIGLPNEEGRLQILNIHCSSIIKNNLLEKEVDLKYLAKKMNNYTGAEIEAVVKSASSFALNSKLDLMNFSKKIEINENIKIGMGDFMKALEEVRPEFGVQEDKLNKKGGLKALTFYEFEQLQSKLKTISTDILNNKIKQNSVLIYGESGTGKTVLACNFGIASGFPFIKLISPEDMVGHSEYYKMNTLVKHFDDANRSPFSLIIIDEIERIIEYVPIGNRFNNNILQTLLVLIKQTFTSNVMVIGTTSNVKLMKYLGLFKIFNIKFELPKINNLNNDIDNLCRNILSSNDISFRLDRDFKISIRSLVICCEMMEKEKGDWTERLLKVVKNVEGDDDYFDES